MTSNKYRTAKIVTPGGWIISLDEDHWPKNYPGFTNEVAAKPWPVYRAAGHDRGAQSLFMWTG